MVDSMATVDTLLPTLTLMATDTDHTDMLPHTATDMATAAQLTVMDTTIKLLPTIPWLNCVYLYHH